MFARLQCGGGTGGGGGTKATWGGGGTKARERQIKMGDFIVIASKIPAPPSQIMKGQFQW